jgi:hypothetical protein
VVSLGAGGLTRIASVFWLRRWHPSFRTPNGLNEQFELQKCTISPISFAGTIFGIAGHDAYLFLKGPTL